MAFGLFAFLLNFIPSIGSIIATIAIGATASTALLAKLGVEMDVFFSENCVINHNGAPDPIEAGASTTR